MKRSDFGLVIRMVKAIDHNATGNLMRALRKEAGMSLREMARRLNYSAPFVSDLERGNRNWTQALVDQWASVLCPPTDKFRNPTRTKSK